MASIESKYDLSDEARKVVATQVKGFADEAAFNTWLTDMAVFLKAYDRQIKQDATQTAAATTTTTQVIDSVVDNAKKDGTLPPNAAHASSKEKWASALKLENLIIK